MRPTLFAALVLAATPLSGVGGPPVAGGWTVRDLGGRSDYESGDGSLLASPGDISINEKGQVAGTTMVGDHSRAFVWDRRLRLLGVLPGDTDSGAADVNDRGQIVGTSWITLENSLDRSQHPFLWDKGRIRDLGLPPGAAASWPVAMNDSGQIAGTASNGNSKDEQAWIWEGGRYQEITPPQGYTRCATSTLNEKGQVIGTCYTSDNLHRTAFLWQGGRMRVPTVAGYPESSATNVNGAGQVVGKLTDSAGGNAPSFIWKNGKTRLIQLPATGSTQPWSWEPLAINEKGTLLFSGADEWAVWEQGKLQSRGPGEPMDLNERGQFAINSDFGNYAFPALRDSGKTTRLPLLRGDKGGAAIALNDHDQVVGVSCSMNVEDGLMDTYYWHCRIVIWSRAQARH